MHATPRPLIVPLFSSLSPLLFFLFYPLRLILARSCNRLVCYSREPINISFKCPFKRTKIVENRWKIRIDTRLVYNTKWYTDVTNSRIIRLWRRGKIIIILRVIFVFYSRHLVSSLGLFSNPREIFSSPLLCRDDDFEKRISRASKKKKKLVRGRHEIASLENYSVTSETRARGRGGGVEFFTLELARRNAGIGNYAVTTRGGVPTYYHLFSGRRNSPAPADLVAKLTSS